MRGHFYQDEKICNTPTASPGVTSDCNKILDHTENLKNKRKRKTRRKSTKIDYIPDIPKIPDNPRSYNNTYPIKISSRKPRKKPAVSYKMLPTGERVNIEEKGKLVQPTILHYLDPEASKLTAPKTLTFTGKDKPKSRSKSKLPPNLKLQNNLITKYAIIPHKLSPKSPTIAPTSSEPENPEPDGDHSGLSTTEVTTPEEGR